MLLSSTFLAGKCCSYLTQVRKPWPLYSQDTWLHPKPLVLFLPCYFCPVSPSVSTQSALFLVFEHLVSLPSPPSCHLWTRFTCLTLPVLISVSDLLPASCFNLSSRRCYVSVAFYKAWLNSLPFCSLLLLVISCTLLFRRPQTYSQGLFPVFLLPWATCFCL